MTQKQHTRRHLLLHAALNELAADWISQQGLANKNFFINSITLEDFLIWSGEQAKNATTVINMNGKDISKFYHRKPSKKSKAQRFSVHLS